MALRKMNTNNKGFSLVELMIVVAIIGLLAAIGVPQYAKFQARARQSEAKAALGALYSAEQAFFQEWNCYSSDLRNIGFGVTGSGLRYYTGFLGTAAAPANPAGCNAGVPPASTTVGDAMTNAVNSPTGTWNAAMVVGNHSTLIAAQDVVPTNTVFTAVSAGDPKNTIDNVSDGWTINQNKLLSNPVPRL